MSSLVNINNIPTCGCGEYYKYDKFKDLCSQCYVSQYNNSCDDELFLKLLSKKEYSKNYLDELTKGRSLPLDHFLWAALKQMFETGAVIKETNFLDWIGYLEKHTIYRGIDTTQAIELKNLAENSNNQYIKNILKEKKWKLGHNICSLIIDWWNIPNYKISEVQCYYHRNEKGQYPLLSDGKLDPAPIFNRNCQLKKCDNHRNDISKCQISHNSIFSLTLKNLAQNY